jgi:APA family basic amino acid/polyamine antiporter
MLISAVFLYLVPAERVTSADAFISQAGEVLFGRTGGVIFSVIVIISVLGSLEAVVLSAPRVYFAMARDQLFFPAAAALHPRFKTPMRAIWLQAALASVLVLSGNFNQIIAYFIFITVVFIALTVAAVFVLRKKNSDAPAFRVPGYPFTPLLFLILVAVLLSLLAMNNPLQAFIGVAVVGLGAIVYRIASLQLKIKK